jgi:Bacterial Ig domain
VAKEISNMRQFGLPTLFLLVAIAATPLELQGQQNWTLIGWNNLGMHCLDADYALFSLLPPYNTIQAQLIDAQGRLIRDPGAVTVTYEAVADPHGSINRTSRGKTNFWDHVEDLFGVAPPIDEGLAGSAMPGETNQPQPMQFDAERAWFIAEGIPLTPYDDGGDKNTYPLFRLVARDGSGQLLASTEIVLPVSDETTCKACHASDASPAAQPLEGWANDPDPDRDMRLNILRLHDDREARNARFNDALAEARYDSRGLFATATEGGISILCARCHASEALPGSGLEGIEPLTLAIHRRMAFVLDPISGVILDSEDNRSACYRCHPGSETRCLRGAMGNAVAADGTLAIQCQSCHGSMRDVASPDRVGWLDEPACQSCHTGTALHNSGAIRFTSAFEQPGMPRQAADDTFATDPDTPAAGLSLYRFSTAHGSLACPACHGSTHAEYPSSQENDNLQSLELQGHVGLISECSTCHASGVPSTVDGGPHGLHPLGDAWVSRHGSFAEEGGAAQCRACHGLDYRGTELSRAQADRTLHSDFGTKQLWRGFQVSCYLCHRGPSGGENRNPNQAPAAADAQLASAGRPVQLVLSAGDPDGDPLTLRIVSQPTHGTVGLDGNDATYFPEPGFVGDDVFTFAAWDGSTQSNLARVSVSVEARQCTGDCNQDGSVTLDEVVTGVGIALGRIPMSRCHLLDANADARASVMELVAAVNVELNGC